jgi:hypothetical protein
MWVLDIFLLITSTIVLFDDGKTPHNEGDDEEQPVEKLSLLERVVNWSSTTAFVLIQIFILLRLDNDTDWSWFIVFIPWYVYEFLALGTLVKLAFFTIAIAPNYENITLTVEEGQNGEEDLFMQRIQLETAYFEKVMSIQRAQKAFLVSVLRIWQALFLAAQIDGIVDWNWGLVFLPIWIYLFIQYGYVSIFRLWGSNKLSGLDAESIMTGRESDPVVLVRFQQGNELIAYSSLICMTQLIPLFMAIMLVCRLQNGSYSTFLIILPVFVLLGCVCCVVFCGLCCLSAIDMDSLEEELEKANKPGNGGASDVEQGVTGGVSAEGVYQPPAPTAIAGAPGDTYGTFEAETASSPLQGQRKALPAESKKDEAKKDALTPSGVDVDID